MAGWPHGRHPAPARRDAASLLLLPLGQPRAARERVLRRPRRGRRDHRGRGRARCRQPGALDRPGREGRFRLRHLVEVLEARPRRPALPPAARVPTRLREPGRAPAPARERAAPGLAAPLLDPAVRAVRRRVQGGRALVLDGAVALRPHRRDPHRQAAQARDPCRGARPPPTARHRPTRGRVLVLRRTHRRRAPDPHGPAHRRRRLRRSGRQLCTGHRFRAGVKRRGHRGPGRGPRGAGVIRLRRGGAGGGQRDRRVDRRGPLPRRGHPRALAAARQGGARHRAGGEVPGRHRGGDPGAQGPPLDLRRALARGRPRVPRHDGHRLRGRHRRPPLHRAGRRLPARRGQRRQRGGARRAAT